MEIFKVFTIEAAHRLPHVPAGHKCGRLHGHTFQIEVHVQGPLDPKLGWIIDFADIKSAFRPIEEQIDHNYLNEVEGLENPTSENVARWVWRNLKPSLPCLSKIVIRETCSSGCIYAGESEA
jgi:6-pyruvoyltetrahydropterin/6-carboxytetrahydropterin synthase